MNKRIVWACWTVLILGATGFLALQLQSSDRRIFLPGETTSGHYQIEISCESCHTPFGGVRQESCLQCHEQELKDAEDSHPKAKFTDPRNADRVARLDARLCVTCHIEHRPEVTGVMGVTLPQDVCFHCHADVAEERSSHTGMAFNTCVSAGCHKFHDNRALYTDFLLRHAGAPDVLAMAVTPVRSTIAAAPAASAVLLRAAADAPPASAQDPRIVDAWAATAHAAAGVNCTACHNAVREGQPAAWTDRPDHRACTTCHQYQSDGFLAGKHGMRLAAGLTPMSPALARLPMHAEAGGRSLDCTSCHSAHEFDTRRAAVDACLECHADRHSVGYKASPHFALWRAEMEGAAAGGSGVSCATCHLPREVNRRAGADAVEVQHNQNLNLRPNEKMIRSVCLNCHSLGFSIDALADRASIETNFNGRPARHIESIDMAVRSRGQ